MKSLSINGVEIACIDRGSGPPVLLVHGFPLDHTMWAGQIDVLSSQNRVIAPDLRGFGRSPVQGDKVTMEQFADDLADLLDGLSIREPVVLCGLSMGGYIAFQFQRRHAKRLRGLILCDTRAAADAPEAAAARRETADHVLREGLTLLIETMLPKLFAETTRREHPHVLERVRRVMRTTDPRGVAAALRGMAERHNMTAALSEMGCPTLVIVGREDVVSTPAEMRGMAKAIPNSIYVEIPAAGHLSPLENPAAVNGAILEFLSSPAGGAKVATATGRATDF